MPRGSIHCARLDVESDRTRAQLTDAQCVERRRDGERQEHADDRVRCGDRKVVPPAAGHRTGEPRDDRARHNRWTARARRRASRSPRRASRARRRRESSVSDRSRFLGAQARQRAAPRRARRRNRSRGVAARRSPASTAIAIAAAAAALTPVRYGSTSGLRSMPCSIAPQSASDAPTTAAMQTRGRRSCQTIVLSTPLEWGWESCSAICSIGERRTADEHARRAGCRDEQQPSAVRSRFTAVAAPAQTSGPASDIRRRSRSGRCRDCSRAAQAHLRRDAIADVAVHRRERRGLIDRVRWRQVRIGALLRTLRVGDDLESVEAARAAERRNASRD